MPNIVREDIDSLNAVLKIVISKNDYEADFNSELKKIKNKATIKGFRKGKTPINFLKKMYGKGLLSDLVTDLLEKELSKEINGEGSKYLGRPIPTKDHRPVDFNVNNLSDYEFKFEIGVAPDFEVKGLDGELSCDFYKVPVPEEKVDEQIDILKKQKGERVDADDNIQENDVLTLKAKELDNGSPKEDGWETTFTIIGSRLEDNMKEMFLSKKKGDTVQFNIFKLEKDTEPEYVKKYLLNFTEADIEEGTETGEEYEAVIEEVKRLVPAELTQELFDELLGEGEISSEEELRERIRTNLGVADESSANTILFRDIKNNLLELNRENMPLPDDYLKRWVEIGFSKEADSILDNFEYFADDMRWSLIKSKLYKKYGLKIDEEEIRKAVEGKIMGYFGGQLYPGMEDMVKNLVEKTMENKEEVERTASDVMSSKLFFELKNEITLNEVEVSPEELGNKMREIEAENKATAEKLSGSPAAADEEE